MSVEAHDEFHRDHKNPADLRSGIDRLDQVSGRGVPELDGSVCRSSTSRQSSGLPGAPADGFDSCLVAVQGVDGVGWMSGVPKLDPVVV